MAATLPEEMENAAPGVVLELWGELGQAADHTTLWEGIKQLGREAAEFCTQDIKNYIGQFSGLMAAVFLSGLVYEAITASKHPTMVNYAPMAGVLAITAIAGGSVKGLIGLASQTVEELDVLGKALLPTLAAATAAGGGVVCAGVQQVSTVVFSNFLLSLLRQLFVPLVYCYIAASAINAVLPEQPFCRLANGIRKAALWGLTGMMTVFTGYLTLSGAVATAGDAVAMRVTKSAVSAAVPVVGHIISDATGGVLASAMLLKNSIGIFGVLGILAVCLVPFLTIAGQYLLYKITAFLCAGFGENTLVEYINALGGAFGMLLGMVASCGLLLLISVISSIKAVIL